MNGGKGAKIDIRETGRTKAGKTVRSDRRLFVQFLAFGGAPDPQKAARAAARRGIDCVIYADLNDPRGIGILFMSEDENFFVDGLRNILNSAPFDSLALKGEYSMFGRTYSLGYESDLDETLVDAPKRKMLDPDWPWAVWYPLRRAKGFETLSGDEQRAVLGEHGKLGFKYGEAGLVKDIRLACHGVDKKDNDFVIGLLGRHLYPLSSVVQAMRKTKQTSQYIEEMGPFFAGKAIFKTGSRK
ncbi:MAG: chlorite dismutase family protein [Candidatus Dadabacteria bacterium]|nr:chlorite dismutase family protein [Candidatus Dadabacteria bacterium]